MKHTTYCPSLRGFIRRMESILLATYITACMLLNTFCMVAAERGTEDLQFTKIASWPEQPRGIAYEVAVYKNTAYLAIGDGGLLIINVSDPTLPKLVRRIFQDQHVNVVKCYNDHLYVGTLSHRGSKYEARQSYRGKLNILNLKNPFDPSLISSYQLGSPLLSMFFHEDQLLVGEGDIGSQSTISQIDVSDPANPKLFDLIQTNTSTDIFLRPNSVKKFGNQIYLSSGGSFSILNWQKNQALEFLKLIPFAGILEGWHVQDHFTFFAYRAIDWSGLNERNAIDSFIVFDNRLPSNSGRVASLNFNRIPLSENPYAFWRFPRGHDGMRVVNGYAYTCFGSHGISVIDIQNPLKPSLVSQIDTPGIATHMEIVDGLAYVADSFGGLQIIDISNPQQMNIVGQLETGRIPRDFILDGEKGLLLSSENFSNWNYTMEFLDLTLLPEIKLRGSHRINHPVDSVEYNNDLVFITWTEERKSHFEILDTRNPAAIVTLSNTTLTKDLWIARLARILPHPNESYICVSESARHPTERTDQVFLKTFDITDPSQPKLIGQSNTEGMPVDGGLSIHRNRLYQNIFTKDSSDRLEVFEISQSSAPKTDGAVTLPQKSWTRAGRRIGGLDVNDDFAYVGLGWKGFAIVDVEDHTNPVLQSEWNTDGEVVDLQVYQNHLLTAEGEYGLNLYEVSNPKKPQHLTRISTYGQTKRVEMSGRNVFVVDQGSGLNVFSFVKKNLIMINQPESQSVVAGDHATIQVKVFASNPISYQWYLGESGNKSHPLPGETQSTLTTEPIDEQKRYWVHITDGPGAIDSETAVISPIPTVKVELVGRWPEDPNQYKRAGHSTDVAVSGSYIYLADGVDGVRILDGTDVSKPKIIGNYPPQTRQVVIQGNRLFLSGNNVQAVGINNPFSPVQQGQINLDSDVLFPTGDFLLLGGEDGWQTIDLRNPMRFGVSYGSTRLSNIEEWAIKAIAASESFTAVSQGWGGIQILDTTEPTQPKFVTSYYPNASIQDLVWKDDWILATQGDTSPGLELVDMKDPHSPTRSASIDLPSANKVAVMDGSYACVTGKGLRVLDYGDRNQLIQAGAHGIEEYDTFGLEVQDNLVFVAGGEDGLLIYRITPELHLSPPIIEGNQIRLSWMGAPGIGLQESTDLTDANWQDIPGSYGQSEIRIPLRNTSTWYKLKKN